MVYIISTILRKALKKHDILKDKPDIEKLWKTLMLTPFDYGEDALNNPITRKLMEKI
jgi:hypothetical protein